MKQKILSLFSGVGGIELGFEQTGKFETVYANDFDKYACITYSANNNIKIDSRDIHNVNAESLPDCDVIAGGFPCQAFSIAGKQQGFNDDRGLLFFQMLRIINNKKPKIIFMENVKNLVSHDHGNTFKVICNSLLESGYYIKYKVMNTKNYSSIPQNRERIYIVGFLNKDTMNDFSFPSEVEAQKPISELINFDKTVDEKYYYKETQPSYMKMKAAMKYHDRTYSLHRGVMRASRVNTIPTLTAAMGGGGNNVPLILTLDNKIRKMTPREVFNAQGFPSNFVLPNCVSNTQLYKQAGNSVSVPVINRIAKQIIKAEKY